MRASVIIGIAFVALALLAPSVAGQPWPGTGSTAGDPRVLDDGAACFEAARAMAGTTCSVLYFHISDLLSFAPVTLQRPADCADDIATGFRSPGVESMWDLNDVDGAAMPTLIHYGDCESDPRAHYSTGMAGDIEIDTRVPMYGYWYLSVDADEFPGVGEYPGLGPDVGVAPCVTLRMTLWAGRPHAEMGTIIAAGETAKTIVSSRLAGDGRDAPLADDAACPFAPRGDVVYPETVTEFEVVLQPLVPPGQELSVSAKHGLSMRAEWYQFSPDDPDDQGEKLYPADIDMHTGPLYVNRIVLPIRDTVEIDRFAATPGEGKLALEVNASSAWGAYDLDPETLRVDVRGADGFPLPLHRVGEPVLRYSVEHDGLLKPVYAVLPWDVLAENLVPGPYTLTASIQNYQHTSKAERSVEILVGDNGFMVPNDPTLYGVPEVERDTIPAPAPMTVLLAAAGLLFLSRRSFSHAHKNVK